ncbi:acetylglutamate kinase [Solibacillus sp. R5-41]|uniref:acetylglutamate kinase n=1 Tax=Solibacillus sp. R5-41 TaxID=2048654 RepID=UPI000C12615D|nr:acetylglutamate kinase [Solibacillus sp. R5-41]ATP41464.1 acetylglutamate kinase [Solibacillus sp. R5-41]
MTTFKSTHHTVRKMVIKLGGSTLEGLNEAFFRNFKALQHQGIQLIITHGGGPAINRELAAAGIESYTVNGLRVTNEDMIGIVQSTLIGKVNPALVHELTAAGIAAVGLNGFDGNLLESHFLDEATYGYVGEVKYVHTRILNALSAAGIVPVIACIGTTREGQALNINGDTVASEIALAVGADRLLLVTDVAGIRINDEYQREVTPTLIKQWIEEGHINGGMIPKVQGAINCLSAGIPSVQIVNETLTGTTILSEELVQ